MMEIFSRLDKIQLIEIKLNATNVMAPFVTMKNHVFLIDVYQLGNVQVCIFC